MTTIAPTYHDVYARWRSAPEAFWAEAAEAVHWYRRWDAVLDSSRALVATNDNGQIIAVSPAATGVLGFSSQALVGRRVLAVIPTRFRQAHVAGMTLHMINGRGPLLEQEVTVPMLCADGTERSVRLEVRPTRVAGERVFVGEFLLN